jgi:hypothetical protein
VLIYYLFDRKHYQKRRRIRRIAIWVYLVLAGALFIRLACIFHHQYLASKYVYSAILILLSFLMYALFHWVDRRIMYAREKSNEPSLFKKYGWNSAIYIAMFFIIIIALWFIIYVFNHINVAPESLLLFLFAFYVFFIDLVFYIAKLNRITTLVAGLLITGVLALYIFHKPHFNLSHFTVDYAKDDTTVFRKDLGTFVAYYDNWKTRIDQRKDKRKPFPIILIAGEGGGSRAGYWFAQSLINLDSFANGHLKQHLFSISTASGSTVGAGAMLGYWQYRKDHQVAPQTFWTSYPGKVFRNNFTSGCVYGLLFEDMWKTFFPGKSWYRDRNSHLQSQEAISVQRALHELYTTKELETPRLFNRDEGLGNDEKPYLLNKDFLGYFYEMKYDSVSKRDTIVFRTDMPLLFVNTCRSSDTRRGIISPVRLTQAEFPDAIDITRFIYARQFESDRETITGLDTAVSLGTAVNMSELFPFLSAPAKIDRLGYFIDGGYHDNSGLKTTMDIYQRLESLLKHDGYRDSVDYELQVIYLKNGWTPKKYYPGEVKDVLPGLQPLFAVANSPFGGSASYYEERAALMCPRFTSYYLSYKQLRDTTTNKTDIEPDIYRDLFIVDKNDSLLNFPLARWTSNTVMNLMNDYSIRFYKGNASLRNLVAAIKDE